MTNGWALTRKAGADTGSSSADAKRRIGARLTEQAAIGLVVVVLASACAWAQNPFELRPDGPLVVPRTLAFDLHFILKNYDRSIADYTEAIRLDPKHGSAFHYRGDAWYEKASSDKALADYAEAIRLDPQDPWPYNGRSGAWEIKREFDRALDDLNTAIRLAPKTSTFFANRASVWLLKHDTGKAGADLETARRLDPNDVYVIYTCAVFEFLKRSRDASDGFHKASELAGWRDQLAGYATLMEYFWARNDGHRDQSSRLLDEAAQKCDPSAWPYPVIKYLRGEIGESTLMAAGNERDRMTDVRCFLGLKALREGKNDIAPEHFRWVVEYGNASSTQYAISLIELDRLEGK